MPEIVNGITVPVDGDPVNLPGDLRTFAEGVGDAAADAGAAAAVGYASGLDATKMKTVLDGSNAFTTGLSATIAQTKAWAKNPDQLVVGALTYTSGLLSSAAVVWPDGATGTLTITSRQTGTDAVLAYNITRVVSGDPTKTYTQPAITRDSSGLATNVPQIVVS